jgi:hypothetical protein
MTAARRKERETMNTEPLNLDEPAEQAWDKEGEARLRFGEMCVDFVYGVPDDQEERRWTPTRDELRQAAADWSLRMEQVEAQQGQTYFAEHFAVKRPEPEEDTRERAVKFKANEAFHFDIIVRSAAILLLSPWASHAEFVRHEVAFWFRRLLIIQHGEKAKRQKSA